MRRAGGGSGERSSSSMASQQKAQARQHKMHGSKAGKALAFVRRRGLRWHPRLPVACLAVHGANHYSWLSIVASQAAAGVALVREEHAVRTGGRAAVLGMWGRQAAGGRKAGGWQHRSAC